MADLSLNWASAEKIESQNYVCGHCGNNICSESGFRGEFNFRDTPTRTNVNLPAFIYICHQCTKPTFIVNKKYMEWTWEIQVPGASIGNDVADISDEMVQSLYNEARDCFKVNAFTASVLSCRKLLMHIAVSKGAEEGQTFIQYVEYFSEKNFIPPGAKDWVDHIRQKGNEANHEIVIMEKSDAKDLINFIEMLLKIIFEFPAKIKGKNEEK